MTGKNLLKWRLSLKLTKKEAADWIGISRPTYASYEMLQDRELPRYLFLACKYGSMEWASGCCPRCGKSLPNDGKEGEM